MMRFKNSKSAKKFWALVIILVSGLGIALSVLPLVNTLTAASDTVKGAESSKASAEERIASYEQYRNNVNLYNEENQKVSNKFPQGLNSIEYTQFVQSSATRAGMSAADVTNLSASIPVIEQVAALEGTGAIPEETIGGAESGGDTTAPKDIDPVTASEDTSTSETAVADATIPAGNIAKSTVSITANGSVTELNNFVDELTSGASDFTLVSYTIAPGGDEGSSVATIEGKAYFYRSLEQPTSGED